MANKKKQKFSDSVQAYSRNRATTTTTGSEFDAAVNNVRNGTMPAPADTRGAGLMGTVLDRMQQARADYEGKTRAARLQGYSDGTINPYATLHSARLYERDLAALYGAAEAARPKNFMQQVQTGQIWGVGGSYDTANRLKSALTQHQNLMSGVTDAGSFRQNVAYPMKYAGRDLNGILQAMAHLNQTGQGDSEEYKWLQEHQYDYWTEDDFKKQIAYLEGELDRVKGAPLTANDRQQQLVQAQDGSYETERQRSIDALNQQISDLTARHTQLAYSNALSNLDKETYVLLMNYASASEAEKARVRRFGYENSEGSGGQAFKRLMADGYSRDEALALLDYAEKQGNARNRQRTAQAIDDIANSGFLGAAASTLLGVPTRLAGGVLGFADAGAQYLTRKTDPITGRKSTIDWNTAAMEFYRAGQDASSAVSQQIDSPVGKFAYNVLNSVLDSAAVAPIPGGEVLLGFSAAMQSAEAAKARGASDGQALLVGFFSGAAEAACEHLPLERIRGLATSTNSARRTFKNVLLDMGKQAGIEGAEEVATDILNRITDDAIMGAMSEYNTRVRELMAQGMSREEAERKATGEWVKSVGEDFLAGALSGGIMGGGAMVVNQTGTNVRNQKTGARINANDYGAELREYAAAMPEGSESQRLLGKLDNATGRRANRLTGALYNAVQTEGFRQAIQTRLQELGATSNASATAEAIRLQAAGAELTQQQRALTRTRAAQRVLTEFQSAIEGYTGMTNEWAYDAMRGAYEMDQKALKRTETETESRKPNVTEFAERFGEQAVAVDEVRRLQPELDSETFERQFETAYELGRGGAQMDVAMNTTATADLTETQRQTAWEMGRAAAEATVDIMEGENENGGEVRLREGSERNDGARAAEPVRGLEEGAEPAKGYPAAVARSAKDEGADSVKFRPEAVSTRQLGVREGTSRKGLYIPEESSYTPAMKEAVRVAEEHGRKIVLFGGGNLEVRENGYVVSARGMYDEATNTVYVRADHPEYTADQIARHENGHGMVADGSIDVKELQKQISASMTEAELRQAIDDYVDLYDGTGLTEEQIIHEMICDALGNMNVFEEIDVFKEQAQRAERTMPAIRSAVQEQQNGRAPPEGKTSGESNAFSREFSGYDVYNDRALISEDTLDKWLSGGYFGSSNPNYAQAYAAYMSPKDFLTLTTSDAAQRNRIYDRAAESKTVENTVEQSKRQPIQLVIDHETGEVNGHEGRHRMVALQRAGVTQVPVLLFDSSNKYSKTHMDLLTLKGQFDSMASVDVHDLEPLSQGNRQTLVEKFATPTKRERQYEKYGNAKTVSFSRELSASDRAYMQAVESGDMETAQRMVDEAANTVYVRADHPEYTADQIARHENGHGMIADGSIDVKELQKQISASMTEAELRQAIDDYVDLYDGTGLTEEQIIHEMICDALGNMNVFEEIDVFKEQAQRAERTMPAIRSAVQEQQNGRVPPEGKTKKDGVKFSYAGIGAETANFAALDEAERRIKSGEDADTVRRETGWFRGADGKWRFEIDDSGMRYDSFGDFRGQDSAERYSRQEQYYNYRVTKDATREQLLARNRFMEAVKSGDEETAEQIFNQLSDEMGFNFDQWASAYWERHEPNAVQRDYGPPTLADYIDHPALFKAYPWLKNTPLYFTEEMEEGENGYVTHGGNGTNFIVLSAKLKNAPESTLLHEIQHIIQREEGFASGSNPAAWNRRIERGYDNRTSLAKSEQKRLQKQMDELRTEDPKFFDDFSELYHSSPNVPRGEVDFDTLEQITEDPPEWQAWDAKRDAMEEKYGDKIWNAFRLFDTFRQVEMNPQRRDANDLYRNTAGEIEARDTASRRNMTADERRNTPPNTGDENTVFAEQKFSRELDAEYMQAVESGDTETAQRMVDEAAKKAGYDIRGYHGTAKHFTVFDKRKINSTFGVNGGDLGFYFTPYESDADEYASYAAMVNGEPRGLVLTSFLKMENPLIVEDDGWGSAVRQADIRNGDLKRWASQGNHDGIIVRSTDEIMEDGLPDSVFIVFEPEQIKSADPVTYDDDGNVIPLSERFNPERPDIRFSRDIESLTELRREGRMVHSRQALAEALETTAQTEEEREVLEDYQQQVSALGDIQNDLTEVRSEALRLRREMRTLEKKDDAESVQRRKDLFAKIRALDDQARGMSEKLAKQDRKLLRLESMEAMDNLIQRERAKERERTRKHDKEVARREKERREESAAQRKYRARIEKSAKTLGDWLLKNSDKEHIPEPLKKVVGDFLSTLDFTSKRALKGGEATKKDQRYAQRLNALANMLDRQKAYYDNPQNAEQQFYGYLDMPDEFVALIRKHIEQVQEITSGGTDVETETPINKMSAAQLEDLDFILETLTNSIKQINSLVSNGRFHSVIEAAKSTMVSMYAMREFRLNRAELKRFLQWDNTNPIYAFRRFGDGGMAVFEGLQNGWDQFAFNVSEVLGFAKKTYKDKEVREWAANVQDFTLEDGHKIRMTTAQIMSFYELLKREQALGHINGGGLRVDNIEQGRKKIQQTEHFHLTEKDIGSIVGTLTDRQREVADALQGFMQNRGSEWGNEVSMKRFGYEAFGEPHYFPIVTESSGRPQENPGQKGNDMYRLLNMSMTKGLTPNANNALVVQDIFDVFADHMSDMAKYNALALPVLDVLKWYNYTERSTKDEDGRFTADGTRKSLEYAYGKGAEGYIDAFLADLNGAQESGGRGENILLKLVSNYKVAMVAANLRVAFLQPTAYVRAAYVLDGKYLTQSAALSSVQLRKLANECEEHSGIAQWKSHGFFDTNISRGIREQIHDGGGWKNKLQDKAMIGAETGDRLTWGVIWNACKLEQKAKGLTGEKLTEATALRFREVVYMTQVVDSTMTRSHMMRSKSLYAKVTTAFMSEPTLSYNMLLDSYMDYSEDARKTDRSTAWKKHSCRMFKAFSVYAISAAASAVVESLMDALRDDDEYEGFIDKFFEAMFGGGTSVGEILSGNLVNNLNIFAKMPYAKDIISKIQGFDTERLDMVGFSDLIDGIKICYEFFAVATGLQEDYTKLTYNGKMKWYGALRKTLNGLSRITGIPASSALREVVTLWNITVGNLVPGRRIKTYDAGDTANIKKAVENGWLTEDEAIKLLVEKGGADDEDAAYFMVRKWKTGDNKLDVLANMVASGDRKGFNQEAKNLRSHGVEEKTITDAAKGEVRDLYLGHDSDGNPTGKPRLEKNKAIQMLQDYAGMSKDDATNAVMKWTCEVVNGFKYDDIKDQYLDGNISFDRAVELRELYGGKEMDDVTKRDWKFEKEVGFPYDSIDDKLVDGEITERQAKQYWMKYGGLSEDKADEKVMVVNFVNDHPDVDADNVTAARIRIYNEYAQRADAAEFMEYAAEIKTEGRFPGEKTSDGKTKAYSVMDQVAAYINSLDIPRSEKIALFLTYTNGKTTNVGRYNWT